MDCVSFLKAERCAILRIDHPPVNALNKAVRAGLLEALAAAIVDPEIDTIVLTGAARVFSAGADTREFSEATQPPHLPDVVAALEASPKPIIAALNGVAFGGGLELALACHYRLATADARMGLPETTIGLIPGAGGTQRLARLIPFKAATDAILTGKPIAAQHAFELGLIDEIVEGDIEAAAIAFSQQADLAPRRTSAQPLRDAEEALAYIAQMRRDTMRRQPGFEAPLAALEALEAAATLSFENGMARERALFLERRASTQARALRALAQAERNAATIDAPNSVLAIDRVAVIGGGQMGVAIAFACIDANYDVTLIEQNAAGVEGARQRLEVLLVEAEKRGKATPERISAMRQHIQFNISIDAVTPCDLVVEAAFENLDVKRDIFSRLGAVTRPEAILATNTSYLDIEPIAAACGRPGQVIGLHFFAPAHIMRLLEIVRTRSSTPQAIATGAAFAKRLGKIAVVAANAFGFIGNRLYQHYQREAALLVMEGATPNDVDSALRAYGFALGPFATADLSGLDISHAMRQSAGEREIEMRAFRAHDLLVEAGHKGRKTGIGFYDYADKGAPLSEPARKAITRARREAGVTPRAIAPHEITARCLDALVTAGAAAIDAGIAQRASDIDVVFVNGYGFPRWRGGPMQACEDEGIAAALDRVRENAHRFGARWWTPSPLFEAAAQRGSWRDKANRS
jgi:3-hydroxyacyl-CoA dehydrogenase